MKEKKTSDELLEDMKKALIGDAAIPSERPQRSKTYEKGGKRAAKSLNNLFQKDLMVLRKMQG